ncbi:DUF3592 domain-containing protein [Polyangium spumosum]|uniref:DUF3592 domain-containing protein n=1 Tax=Polyangium spumosum TaxID=889282 RepID=A0A6N7PN67_9BACT|nr:DUF3592 domain-containing protein [Polyangium spumosum]MRG92246.1 DUF3592 domain-containing protein [Polyangium spumosum]
MSRRHIPLPPPPRSVPLGVTITQLFGVSTQLGLLFLGIGLIFFWAFAWSSEAVTAFEFLGPTTVTTGHVTAVEATYSSENKRRIHRVRFMYEVDGATFDGASYTTGPTIGPGSSVPVEYVTERPESARVQGLRARPFSAAAAITTIFPLGGLLAALFGLLSGARNTRLLRVGAVGYARLVRKTPTNATVNKQREYKLEYELTIEPEMPLGSYRQGWASWAQKHPFTYKTHETRAVTDEHEEPVLYDPSRPGDALLIDAVKGVVIDPATQTLRPTRPAVLHLVLPTLVLLGNAVYLGVLLVGP